MHSPLAANNVAKLLVGNEDRNRVVWYPLYKELVAFAWS